MESSASESPAWLDWAKELQFIAQAGLTYSKDPFDLERYQRIRDISAEIMSRHTGLPYEQVRHLFCSEVGFQTPKLDTRAAIFKDGKILLVEERDGSWSLPGGWVDVNQTLKTNTEKEVLEEAGLEPLNLLTPAFNANWNKDTAQQTTANWISTYGLPGESGKDTPIELVIANNDDMALGAIAALGQKNWNVAGSDNKVLVIGVDATAAGLSAIQEGTMYGTVKQDGEAMAKCIAALSKNALDGKGFLDGTDYEWESETVRKIRIPYGMVTGE